MMAGYSVNPGPFKAIAADPEGTLERLEDYCRTMEMVFRNIFDVVVFTKS